MRISVTDAKAQLTELVHRAEQGEEVVLTRHEKVVARIVAEKPKEAPEEIRERRRKAIARVQAEVAALNLPPGPSAARSADFLYDEDGLPK